MPVEVTAEDLIRLGLTGPEEIEDSPKRVAERLRRQGIIKNYREKSGLFMLEQKAPKAHNALKGSMQSGGNDCIFLDSESRLCSVYEKRPQVCRDFPERRGLRPGACPAIRK